MSRRLVAGQTWDLVPISLNMSFLDLENRRVVIFGLANRKSVACEIGKVLVAEGAEVIHVVRSAERAAAARKLFPNARVFVCDVEKEDNIIAVKRAIEKAVDGEIDGLVHSIAYANYTHGIRPFHETNRQDFLQSVDVSCFSMIAISNYFKDILSKTGSVVTISISDTRMAAENYGYMAPIKAALESSVCFLAKSFSRFSQIRFNAVCPGLLKTSASAGIPGYIDSYLFAEKLTLRKMGLKTKETADLAAFLLSPRSSGINAQAIVVDAGMGINYFDADIIAKVLE